MQIDRLEEKLGKPDCFQRKSTSGCVQLYPGDVSRAMLEGQCLVLPLGVVLLAISRLHEFFKNLDNSNLIFNNNSPTWFCGFLVLGGG